MENIEVKPVNPHAVTRPPIVVVMGHIDHGKTTLLDYIRKTRVADRETGGITQAIGAYQVEHRGKKITFIDTPGHEAFSAMRARGARVADIAVLVVAADEGVKPQTEEAIGIIQEHDIPMVVAINKIDKPNADSGRVKKELAEKKVLVEGFGGRTPAVELSAKTGQGTDELLETILLVGELEELEFNPEKDAEGLVIESHLDSRRGASATLLIEDGTMRLGDFLVITDSVAPIRIFENFLGKAIPHANASEPIRIAGLPRVPELGEKFMTGKTKEEAEMKKTAPAVAKKTEPRQDASTTTVVNIILKTDVVGSKEAVETTLITLSSPELGNRILKSDVGDISESDVKLAAASNNAFIVGFKVKVPPHVQELAERQGVAIVERDVIYDLVDAVKAAMMAMAPPVSQRLDLGQAKILALFKEDRGKQIAGGRVEQGKIQKNVRFDVVRNQRKIGSGRVVELQTQRQAVEEVSEGREFGILTDADIALAVNDMLAIFSEEKVIPKL